MRNYLTAVLIFLAFSISAQEKYLIFFKDKGFGTNPSEEVLSAKLLIAEKSLSPKCLVRRAKTNSNLVDYYDIPVSSKYLNVLKSNGIKIVHKLNWFNAVSARMDFSQLKKIESLNFVKGVRPVKEWIFKNKESRNLKKESGAFSTKEQKHKLDYGASLNQLEMSQIPELHDIGITGKGVLMGIMDTGFDWKALDVFKHITVVAEHDFVFNDDVTANQPGDRYDQDEHGTEILSIISGYSPGYLIGSAFDAKFVLAKTEDVRSETHVEEDNYAAALEWFERLGVDITSSSLGYNEFNKPERSYTYADMNGKTAIVTRAAEIAFQKGLLVITAAGNEASQPWHYIIAPADGFNTIAVGALNADGTVTTFSSRGPTADGRIKPDVCALGVSVHVVNPFSTGFANVSGTSASTPIVSGGAALLLSAFPYLNNVQLRKILLETASNSQNPNNDIGYGLFSALKAINYPNIKKSGDSIFVNRYFYFEGDSITSTPAMFVSQDEKNFTRIEGKREGQYFSFLLPEYFSGDSLHFYFEYTLAGQGKVQEPAVKYYSYTYGENVVSHYTQDINYPFVPEKFFVSANYPNPFNLQTRIQVELPYDSQVGITVYDILGRRVKKIKNKFLKAGFYTETIDLTGFSSGVYFVVFKTKKDVKVQKVVLLK